MDAVADAGDTRTAEGVVAPTRSDQVARASSGVVGGPLGVRARTGGSWWTPLRVVLAVATVMFGLGIVQKSPCVVEDWSDAGAPLTFSHLCYSDISYLYAGRGLAEGIMPYSPTDQIPADRLPTGSEDAHSLTPEYPVMTGMWMGLAGGITHLIGRSPDLSEVPHDAVGANLDVQYDGALFWDVNAVGFFMVLLIALLALVRAQPRRPWDAMFVAASPALALTAMINWDVLAVGFVAGILWAWATRRPVLAGVLIGLGTATKLYPLFVLGPCWCCVCVSAAWTPG